MTYPFTTNGIPAADACQTTPEFVTTFDIFRSFARLHTEVGRTSITSEIDQVLRNRMLDEWYIRQSSILNDGRKTYGPVFVHELRQIKCHVDAVSALSRTWDIVIPEGESGWNRVRTALDSPFEMEIFENSYEKC